MKVKFKVPRHFEGVSYTVGVHEVPDSLSKHWYLLAQLQNGNALIVEDAPVKIEKSEKVVPPVEPSKAPVEADKAPEVAPEIPEVAPANKVSKKAAKKAAKSKKASEAC